MAVDVKVVTYRDIFQYGAEKMGLHSEEYLRLSASIILDKGDMASLGVAEGEGSAGKRAEPDCGECHSLCR